MKPASFLDDEVTSAIREHKSETKREVQFLFCTFNDAGKTTQAKKTLAYFLQ